MKREVALPLLLAFVLVLAGCLNSTEKRLVGTWKGNLGEGTVVFTDEGKVIFFGEEGTFSASTTLISFSSNSDSLTLDLPGGEREFSMNFSSNDDLLSLREKPSGKKYHLTRSGSGIGVDLPSGWSADTPGLPSYPSVKKMHFGENSRYAKVQDMHIESVGWNSWSYSWFEQIYRQSGSGSWAPISLPGQAGSAWSSSPTIAVKDAHALTIDLEGIVHLSTNNGSTFTQIDTPPEVKGYSQVSTGEVVFLPGDAALHFEGNDAYAVLRGDHFPQGWVDGDPGDHQIRVFRLADYESSGSEWTLQSTLSIDQEWDILSIISMDGSLYLNSNFEVYRSDDQGVTLENLGSPPPADNPYLRKIFDHNGQLLALSSDGGYLLDPASGTWSPAAFLDGTNPSGYHDGWVYGHIDGKIVRMNESSSSPESIGGTFIHPGRNYPNVFAEEGHVYAASDALYRHSLP